MRHQMYTEKYIIHYDVMLFSVSADPRTRHTVWTQTIGACFTTLVLIGINQAIVQKYLSIPKVRDAQK